MMKLTVSPAAASPPTEPVTLIGEPDSAAFTTSSVVIRSTEMVALAEVSTVWVEVVDPVYVLPAPSVPDTVASKLVSATRSVAATEILKILPAPTVPLYGVLFTVKLTVSPGTALPPTVPVTLIGAPASTALITSSAVILSTVIVVVGGGMAPEPWVATLSSELAEIRTPPSLSVD